MFVQLLEVCLFTSDPYASYTMNFAEHIIHIMPGVFTVFGIIDAFVYHGHRAIKKKIQLNKFS